MRPADREGSPITDAIPSWMLPAHERYLMPGAQSKYKTALKDFQRFLACKQLSQKFLPGHPNFELAPVEVLRRFAQHIARKTKGKIKEEPRTTTTCHKISMLVGAIETLTGMRHSEDVVSEVHAYIKRTLVKEGLVTTKGKPRFDFDGDDIRNTHLVIWADLDPNCNSARKVRSGRFLCCLSALLYLFLIYGSRISAILPKTLTEHTASVDELWAILDESIQAPQHTKRDRLTTFHAIVGDMITGLRYKDFVVYLTRKHPNSDEVEPVVTLAQRFFKNNENPREDALIAWGTMRQNFLRDYIPYVLALAFADKAFRKFADAASMLKYKMRKTLNCEECIWRDEMKDLHIFREFPDSNKPYTQYQWNSGLQLATKQAGYTDTITVHRIRQHTVQKVNATGITPAQHKHLFGQTHATLQKAYMNEHTSIDAQAIAIGEAPRPDIADMLRSAKKNICRGLPTVLTTAQRADAFKQDPKLIELEVQWDFSSQYQDQQTCDKLYNQIKHRRRRVCQERLRNEQSRYHAGQLTALEDDERPAVTISQQRWTRLMSLKHQHARIAKALIDNCEPDLVQRISLLNDLVELARQTEPQVSECQPTQQHHAKPSKDQLSKDQVYCYLCFSAIKENTMDSHITTTHLPYFPMDCGLFYHQSETKGEIINPGLCPFCLVNAELSPQQRFRFFTRRREHTMHLSSHLEVLDGESRCPHPRCTMNLGTKSLIDHFESDHGIDELGHHLDTSKHQQQQKCKPATTGSLKEICPSFNLKCIEAPLAEDFSLPPTENSDDDWMKEFLTIDSVSSWPDSTTLPDSPLEPSAPVSLASINSDKSQPVNLSTSDDIWMISYDTIQLPCRKKKPEANIGSIMRAKRIEERKKGSTAGKQVDRQAGRNGARNGARKGRQAWVRRR